jgi:hypothetical protein
MKEISASRYLRLCGALALALAALVAAVNWLVDPLQFYRKAAYPPDFAEQARFQNPGLARNYPCDAVLTGTSVSLGFTAGEIRDRLGWDALNLAMSGASAHEQSLMLEVALQTGRARHVLWDLNFEYFRGSPDWVSDYDGAFPAYFYDNNPWNEIPHYLLNIDTTKASARVLLQRAGLHLYRPRPLGELSRLATAHPPGRASVLQSLRKAESAPSLFQEQPGEFTREKLTRSFEENVLRPIRSHPEVTFDLWFPPFSVAREALLNETAPGVWNSMFHWKEDIVREAGALPNVRLHDFEGLPGIVLDLDHYSDTVHFDDAIRSRIIEAVANGSARATSESLAQAEAALRREVVEFRKDEARETTNP